MAGGEQREVHFEGHVQGVGFRYTARAIAARYDVTGFVRNLYDGRVQLVVEGAADELDGFLAELGRAMEGYVRRAGVQKTPATGEFQDFEIRF